MKGWKEEKVVKLVGRVDGWKGGREKRLLSWYIVRLSKKNNVLLT